MKVICNDIVLTENQNVAIGYDKNNRTPYELTIGKQYSVIGLSFQYSTQLNKGSICLLRDDIGRCAFVPICLLSIQDSKVSKFWVVKKTDVMNVLIWPQEFFEDYFFDDLSDGVRDVVAKFDHVCQMIDGENK